MICPSCSTGVRLEIAGSSQTYADDISSHSQSGYDIAHGFCPECDSLIVMLRHGKYWSTMVGETAHLDLTQVESETVIYPFNGPSRPVADEVPAPYRTDFVEASRDLSASTKASAAISRRILQSILHDELQIKGRTLADEIDQFIQRPGIPQELRESVDAIRNVGNLAAHPIKNTNTGVVVEVEPGEAEWLLDVLETLFDFAFVQPERLRARKAKLNAKLAAAGKPAMK
jgi:hypothetical protein